MMMLVHYAPTLHPCLPPPIRAALNVFDLSENYGTYEVEVKSAADEDVIWDDVEVVCPVTVRPGKWTDAGGGGGRGGPPP